MKRFVLFVIVFHLFLQLNAVVYYSQGSLNPGALTSWATNPVGGTAPPNFIMAGDRFIIQTGHTMTTIANWTFGTPTSTLQIQNGGTLTANHLIQFTGTFQIDNGGRYNHNDYTNIGSGPGNSIWGGTELFGASSTVEIRDWLDTNPLPAGISWGNLIINVTTTLNNPVWSQEGNLTSIQGNLQIIATAFGPDQFEFRFTTNTTTSATIGGNLIVDGGIFNMKGGTSAGISCDVQVNGNIVVNVGTLSTGSADIVTHADLKFKGNFTAAASTTITSGNNSYLVANGLSQGLSSQPTIDCNLRVELGSVLTLYSTLTTGANRTIVVSGTFLQNANVMTVNGRLECAGGTFTATANTFTVGANCTSCTSDGTYNSVSSTWCTLAGTKGTIIFNNATVQLNNNIATTYLSAGHFSIASPGDVYFFGSTATDAGAGATFPSAYFTKPSSIFALDGNSYIAGGRATYYGQGGTLKIGSAEGITSSGNTGNVRVSAARNYDNTGVNNFEYNGSTPQVTGTGLPTTIGGILTINNTAGISSLGVTLTNATTVDGVLDLTWGKLRTSAAQLMSISASGTIASYTENSFIGGPLKVTGHNSFWFPIGINAATAPTGSIYAPINMVHMGGTSTPTDSYTAQYFRANPYSTIDPDVDVAMDHISFVEYWQHFRNDAGTNTPQKRFILQVNPESICHNLTTLMVARYDGAQSKWVSDGQLMTVLVGSAPPLVWGYLHGNTTTNISSYFTLGTTDAFADNPLPVEFISFDASKLSNTKSSVNWELGATCSPATKFEIQRADGQKSFVSIGTVNGSHSSRLYNFIDIGLMNGVNYYRLKTKDSDGRTKYSRTVAVMNGVNGLLLTSLVPTVVASRASLTIASSHQQKIGIVITDMMGRVVQKQNYLVASGNSNFEIFTASLSKGMYQVVALTPEGNSNMIRFIKQ
jgi:hypothetical protein